MDRRQRKTRQAIFNAFTQLLSRHELSRITVSDIIELADVGRATFYAHFETKDFLLKELCEELFCHLFDAPESEHRHIFNCENHDTVFVHLFRHLQKNDNHILTLLRCPSNALFQEYFKTGLRELVMREQGLFEARKSKKLPEDFWLEHICSVFVETLRWWSANGMKERPEEIAEYFYLAV